MVGDTPTLAGTLRDLIRESGLSINAIAKGTGIAHPVLWRFTTGQRDLRLKTADKLIRYFGSELIPAAKDKQGED